MRIALAQINPTLGDFAANIESILSSAQEAREAGAKLLVCPELCVCGYPPMDLLDHDSFITDNRDAVHLLSRRLPRDLGVIVGHVAPNPTGSGKPLYNSASLLSDGVVVGSQAKTLLPTYDVFDERRYFEPATDCRPLQFAGERIGLTICADIWWESYPDPPGSYNRDPVSEQTALGATLIISPSASPYSVGKPALRCAQLSQVASVSGCPTLYANMVGGNDELVFDGHSMACTTDGRLIHCSPGFREDVSVIDTSSKISAELPSDNYAEIEAAIGVGLRDYLSKTDHERVCLALSGGIDSAVVAAVAARQLGSDRVTSFALPSRFSSDGSRNDAQSLAQSLGINFTLLSIEPALKAFLQTLSPVFSNRPPDTTEENLQARIRGTLVMAFANKTGALALATGNKSELATGYATLYGDMAGAIAPIGDLWKTQVYELARHINENGTVIPSATLNKEPSAELRPNQFDSDSLPPYDVLDSILQRYVEQSASIEEIVAAGYEQPLVRRVIRMVSLAEHKRHQAPIVIKLSSRAFGSGRRFPIARYIDPPDAAKTSIPSSQAAQGI